MICVNPTLGRVDFRKSFPLLLWFVWTIPLPRWFVFYFLNSEFPGCWVFLLWPLFLLCWPWNGYNYKICRFLTTDLRSFPVNSSVVIGFFFKYSWAKLSLLSLLLESDPMPSLVKLFKIRWVCLPQNPHPDLAGQSYFNRNYCPSHNLLYLKSSLAIFSLSYSILFWWKPRRLYLICVCKTWFEFDNNLTSESVDGGKAGQDDGIGMTWSCFILRFFALANPEE